MVLDPAAAQSKLGLDVSDVIQGAKDFAASLDGSVQSANNFVVQLVEFNKNGEVSKATVKGLSESGDEYSVSLKRVKGSLEATAVSVKASTDAMQKLKDAQDQITQKQKIADAGTAESLIRGTAAGSKQLFPDTSNANIRQINAIETAIAKVKQSIEGGNISLQRFQEILKAIQANPKEIIPGLTADEAKLANTLRSITAEFQKAEEGPKAYAKSFLISFDGIIRLAEAQVIKRAIRFLIDGFLEGIESAKEFSVNIANIQTISQGANLSTREWSDEIRRLSDRFGSDQLKVGEAAYAAIASQIVSGRDALGFLDIALKLSQATVSGETESVKALSDALRAFKIPVANAEQVSASLFKTVELGRAQMNEISTALGKVGPVASALGLSLNEVEAAIVTLTQKGVKFGDASQLINGLLTKLIKPTKEMKELLQEMGFASGEAAIQTLGFAGVLDRLDKEASKGGTERLGELLGQFRTVRAAVGLTGDAFNDYANNLQKVSNAQGEFNKATDLVRESLGNKFQREINKVKTYFTDEWGFEIIKLLFQVTDAFGGIASAVRLLVEAAKLATIAFIAFKVAAFAASAFSWISGVIASFTTLEAAIVATTAAARGLQSSTIIGAVAAGVSLLAYSAVEKTDIRQYQQNQLNTYEEGLREKESLNRAQVEQEKADEQQKNLAVIQGVDTRIQAILKYSAEVVRLSNDVTKVQMANFKAVEEQAKVTGKTYADSLKQAADQLGRDVTKAKTNIEHSIKISLDIPKQTEDKILSKKLEFASDIQQIDVLERQIKRVRDEARSLSSQGTQESMVEARRLYSELEKLQADLFTKQENYRRKQLEADVASGRIQGTYDPLTGKSRVTFTADTLTLEKQINQTAQERIKIEQQFQQLEEQRRKKLQEDQDKERERLRSVQDILKDIANFKISGSGGKVKDEYNKDPTKAIKDFDALIQKLNTAAGPDAVNNQFQFFIDLQKQKAALATQIETQIRSEQAETTRQAIINAKKEIDTKIANAQAAQQGAKATIEENVKNIDVQITAFEKAIKDVTQFEGYLSILSPVEWAKIGSSVEVQQKLLKTLEALATKKIEILDAKDFDSQNQKLKEADVLLGQLNGQIEKLLKARIDAGAKTTEFGFTGKGYESLINQGKSIKQELDDFQNQFDAIGRAFKKQVEAAQTLNEAQDAIKTLNDEISKLPPGFDTAALAADTAKSKMVKSFQEIVDQISVLIQQTQTLDKQLQKLNVPLAPGVKIPDAPQAPGNWMGGMPKYMSDGGFVSFIPKGTDRIPAMLDPHEMIMNGLATKKFAPQLVAMNMGIEPNVTNNNPMNNNNTSFGDINIKVEGGKTDYQTLRNIADGLTRQLKRKTITLG